MNCLLVGESGAIDVGELLDRQGLSAGEIWERVHEISASHAFQCRPHLVQIKQFTDNGFGALLAESVRSCIVLVDEGTHAFARMP